MVVRRTALVLLYCPLAAAKAKWKGDAPAWDSMDSWDTAEHKRTGPRPFDQNGNELVHRQASMASIQNADDVSPWDAIPTRAPTFPQSGSNPFVTKMAKLMFAMTHGPSKSRAAAQARYLLLEREAKAVIAGHTTPEASNLTSLVDLVAGSTDAPTAMPTPPPTLSYLGLLQTALSHRPPSIQPTSAPTREDLSEIYTLLKRNTSSGRFPQHRLRKWLMAAPASVVATLEAASGINSAGLPSFNAYSPPTQVPTFPPTTILVSYFLWLSSLPLP
jgi:hypothetical protein